MFVVEDVVDLVAVPRAFDPNANVGRKKKLTRLKTAPLFRVVLILL
jgi:hypothetical protein